jgi:hypothetical protein
MKLILVLLAAASYVAAQAQLTLNTPSGVITCVPNQLTFTGGTAPYILQVVPGSNTSAEPLNTYTGITSSPIQWFVEQAAGTSVFLRLRDSQGASSETAPFTIQAGGPSPCPGPGSTSTGATTGATTPATSAPGATTPTTPAPGTTTNAPTSGGSGSSSSSSRPPSSSSSSTGGALGAAHVAGGVVGLVGVVAAVLA